MLRLRKILVDKLVKGIKLNWKVRRGDFRRERCSLRHRQKRFVHFLDVMLVNGF